MPRIAPSLTDSRIRQTKPGSKPIKLADGGGMYLLVRPDGSRYWRLDYRYDGKRKTLALGVYPEISLAEARKRRRDAKNRLAKGQDPSVLKRAIKSGHKLLAGMVGQVMADAFATMGEGIWDWDLRTDLVSHNVQWARLMGLDAQRLEHGWQESLACLYEADREPVMAAIQDCLDGKDVLDSEYRIQHADGSVSWVQNRGAVAERSEHGKPLRMMGYLREVPEARRQELLMRRRNLLLEIIASVNKMLMSDLSDQALMEHICQEMTRNNLFSMVWIGLVDKDGTNVREAAQAGFGQGYLAEANIRCDDSPAGQGPTGTAIREGKTQINNDTETNPRFAPWREQARARGYRSSAAAPLRMGDKVIGALSVYAPEPNAFGKEKLMLLEKLATDLGATLGHRQMLASLRESEARYRAMAEQSADWVWAIDAQGRHTYSNQRGAAILGYEVDDLLAKNLAELVHPDDLALFRETFEQAMANRRGWQNLVLRWRHKDGNYRIVESNASPLFGDAGELTGFQGVDRDITERKQAEERIEFLAHHDSLTGLPNRILLRDRFEQAMAHAGRTQSHAALLFIDLDNFKAVNDTLGHAAGDLILLEAVRRLSRSTRESDTISRHGGDEFIVLLNAVPDLETVERIAGEILYELAQPMSVGNHVLNSSCSIGIVIHPEDGADYDKLLQKADIAMYNAKEAGRNTYRFFDEQMNMQAHEHLLLQNRLYQSLVREEFQLHFQPQLDIGSGKVIGVETLLRWHDEELGDVGPGRFIPVAEDSGLIVPIGAWALVEACLQAQAWRASGMPDMTLSVNLSALQFRRTNLTETVAGALKRSGLPPHLLELELTESVLLHDVERNLDTVRRLKALGVRLTIDDFGTGYSSLSYLRRFAVDRLKIDQSFVRDITTDPDDAAIVRAIIQLAHSLRLDVVAEGVETPEQEVFLRAEGCMVAQGYLYSRPLPASELEAFLRERNR